jgi:isopenicillin-N epimerase
MTIAGCETAFAFAAGTTYLDHGGFGVAPLEVLRFSFRMREAVEAAPRPFFDAECRPRWRDVAARVAQRFSARPDDLALVDNVTDGVNAVLRSLTFQLGDEILVTSMTYGAVALAARRIGVQMGAAIVEANIPFPAPSPERCVEAIRAALTSRTKLAILDHITSPTALVMPVAEMARACRERGVRVLVDGAHAPGAVPLDIPSIGADWCVGNLHKWYFAPRGCGFLWAHPDRRERLVPTVLSWDIDKPFPQSFEWTGTRDPSAWLSVPAAFDFMDRFGEAEVRKHNHDLVMAGSRLLARAWNVEIETSESMIGAMTLVPLPEMPGFSATEEARAKVQRTLWQAHAIACPCILFERRLYMRICAQIYNGISDYENLARAVTRLT